MDGLKKGRHRRQLTVFGVLLGINALLAALTCLVFPMDQLAPGQPDPAAMLEAIGGDPAAIGYIPKSWLSPAVKEVTIEGQIKELLHQPVLVLAGEEPSGAARDSGISVLLKDRIRKVKRHDTER